MLFTMPSLFYMASLSTCFFFTSILSTGNCFHLLAAGDVEFKQNKFLPAEKQIVTANPDLNTVRASFKQLLSFGYKFYGMIC